MIEFIALDGSTRTAEVWSPGPLSRTVWAFQDHGKPVVVYLDKRQEVRAPGDPRDWWTRPCTVVGLYFADHSHPACSCASHARARYRAECRDVPDTIKSGELLSLL